MSKIGKKPIPFTTAKITLDGKTLKISGSKANFEHKLPQEFNAVIDGKQLMISASKSTREVKTLWGLHRALIANKIKGVEAGFEQKLNIVGLGFKATLAGRKVTLALGYTHKIDYELPQDVTLEIDKTGQLLTFKSANKFSLGNVCDAIRSFRPPEPYKGTGIVREGEVIIRKAGKTKAG